MPTICRFYGILIRMYFNDHHPPHFHAIYNEFEAIIGINDYYVLEGDLPAKALGLVIEWAKIHQQELLQEWRLAQSKLPLFDIHPLE